MRVIFHLIGANGLWWFALYLRERIFNSPFYKQKRLEYEVANVLPGFNTSFYNYKEWKDYDWSQGGEEWTESEGWKDALIEDVLSPFITEQQTVLEIGPGGGRWSVILAQFAGKLVLVDLTEKALSVCKARLAKYEHIDFHRTHGSDLSFVPDSSVDLVWSFDVFVHLSPQDTENYLAEIARVLKPKGVAIVHHPAEGGIYGGFRSSVTNDFFKTRLTNFNLKPLRQVSSWGPDGIFSVNHYKDSISIFGHAG